jgi:hypothetical protein
MSKYFGFFLALTFLICPTLFAAEGVRIGLGFDYIPISKVEYVRNPELNFQVFDNIIWQGRAAYDFGNGFNAGAFFDYYSRQIHPQGYLTSDLALLGIGFFGDYSYEMTDSGHLLLVGGLETGYGRLTDKSGATNNSDGSLLIAGLAGLRFTVAPRLWLNTAYRLSFEKFGPLGPRQKKYLFSGSSLKLLLEYQIYSKRK